MNNKIAITRNLSSVRTAVDAGFDRPGLIVISGFSGLGKTTACNWLLGQYPGRCTLAIAKPGWAPLAAMQAIAYQLGHPKPPGRVDRCQIEIERILRDKRGHFLIIDECNELLKKRTRETLDFLKSIYDETKAPMVLFGEPGFERVIRDTDKLRRRTPTYVEFQQCDLNDARTIVETCCEVKINGKLCKIHVRDDLLERLIAETRGMVGEICMGLERIERACAAMKVQEIGLEEWGEQPFSHAVVGRKKAA